MNNLIKIIILNIILFSLFGLTSAHQSYYEHNHIDLSEKCLNNCPEVHYYQRGFDRDENYQRYGDRYYGNEGYNEYNDFEDNEWNEINYYGDNYAYKRTKESFGKDRYERRGDGLGWQWGEEKSFNTYSRPYTYDPKLDWHLNYFNWRRG